MKKLTRIYHTWDKWECYPCGFFEDLPPNGMSKAEAEEAYANFFREPGQFKEGMERVFREWKNSCEHNLTNEKLNRIAWLGQAAACIMIGLPSSFRSGYNLLTEKEQEYNNNLALTYLNKWLTSKGYPETDGKRNHKSSNIY